MRKINLGLFTYNGAGMRGGAGGMVSCAGQLLLLGQCTILIPGSFDVEGLVTNRYRARLCKN